MGIKRLATIFTVLVCTFAGYNFGKYLEPFTGLLFTAALAFVGVVVINGWATKGKIGQP